jgi:hypothetical protein
MVYSVAREVAAEHHRGRGAADTNIRAWACRPVATNAIARIVTLTVKVTATDDVARGTATIDAPKRVAPSTQPSTQL